MPRQVDMTQMQAARTGRIRGRPPHIIPVDAEVTFSDFRRGFVITTQNDSRKIYFEYNAGYVVMSEDQ